MPESQIRADRGDLNIYEMDANVPLSAANDKIWFTLKHRREDLDADAVLQMTRNVGPSDGGIVVTDEAAGIFQIQIPKDALEDVDEYALLYDCQVYIASPASGPFTVRSGTMLLTGQVTRATV